jgi:hypothetical protein
MYIYLTYDCLLLGVFKIASHFKQCALSLSHWGTDLYPQTWHVMRVRSSVPPFEVLRVSPLDDFPDSESFDSLENFLVTSSSDFVSFMSKPAAAAKGGLCARGWMGWVTWVRGDLEAFVPLEAVEASEILRTSSLSPLASSPRPHLVHFANLNMHLPPFWHSPTPPGFCIPPGPFANFPTACGQNMPEPDFQGCTP